MGFLDRLKIGKPSATDEQIACLRTLGSNASDERLEQVLRNYSHDPTQNLPDLLSSLTEKQADALIKGFLYDPASVSQIGYIQILISKFDRHPDHAQFNEYASEESLAWALKVAGPKGDYRFAKSFDHLSKKQATDIIATLKEKDDAWQAAEDGTWDW
jgi:hypothetical protein